jgi:hypothetical protein
METGEAFTNLNDKGDEFSPVCNQWNVAGSDRSRRPFDEKE